MTVTIVSILTFAAGCALARIGNPFAAKPDRPILDAETLHSLLDLFMVSDPWPLDGRSENRIRVLLNREATKRGYTDWIEALHEMGGARP